MMTTAKMQKTISLILLAGTALSAALVFIGGSLFLWRHGNITLKAELLTKIPHTLDLSDIGLIELGLICLIMTQVVRVALLAWFYAVTRDFEYTIISLFILGVLIYSTLLQ